MGHTTPPHVPIGMVAAFLAFALLVVACAGDVSEESVAGSLDAARFVDEPQATEAPGEPRTPTTTTSIVAATTTTTLVPPTPTDPPRPEPPSLGSLDLPCGRPGDATGVGVDETRIVIGVGDDRGSLHAAGSAVDVVETVRALADRCNALGGIAGRQIVVDEFDAAVVEVDDRMAEACETVFALVGHAFSWDDAGEATRLECELPAFPAWSPGAGDTSPLLAAAVPSTPLPVATRGNLVALLTSAGRGDAVALVAPDTIGGAAVRSVRALGLVYSGLPITVVADLGYAVDREADWGVLVQEARAAGAGVVDFTGACRSALAPFLEAAEAAEWEPAVIAGPDAYDPACVADHPERFGRVLLEMPFLPVEDGDAAPATMETAATLEQIGVGLTGTALRAASAFWLFAVAAESCGDRLDRNCVVTEALAVDDWTAGGLHAPTDPGTTTIAPCAVLLGVEEGRFVRRLPVEPGAYDCVESPTGDVPVAAEDGAGATGTGG